MRKMNRRFAVSPGRVGDVASNRSQRRPGLVTSPGSTSDPASNVATRSHLRRWSADFCECRTPPVIIVRKNRKEPEPPQRGVSLLRPHTESRSSLKRYSCPPTGIFASPSQSSSSSAASSCSSPPPVQTSVITGDDPSGWKLRPKSSAASPRANANRLSLQIPLPVIFPHPTCSQPDSTPTPVLSAKTKPPLRPKPSRRRHSDSSAFLRSLENPGPPAVTLEELCAVQLRPVSRSDESDDVFSDQSEEQVKVNAQPHKIPPPVPRKTAMARQTAQLIHQKLSRVIKPHKAVDRGSLPAAKTGKCCRE